MQKQRELALVDDDADVRDSIVALLSAGGGMDVRAFASAEELLAALQEDYRPGAILSDVRMPGMSGLELQEELVRTGVRVPLILITGHGHINMAVSALKAGAADFIEKPFDETALLGAIDRAFGVAEKQGEVERKRADVEARVAQLSQRQKEVMDLVVRGLSTKEIAIELGISPRTVDTYRLWIMEKTGARNLAELVRMAMMLERT